MAADVLKFGPQIAADIFEKLLFAPASYTDRPKLLSEVYGWMTENASAGLAGGLLAMRERKDYSQLLSTVQVPALAIGAAQDQAAPPETSMAIAAGIQGCTLCIIPDAGHMVNLEDVKSFTNSIKEFLGVQPS
jgi:pimeloyl-ACP methyl ester carboxylesterase